MTVRDPAAALELLRELGDHLRDAVLASRGIDMARVEGETPADTIYAIDKVTDDALVAWFEQRWTDVELVSEGLPEPLVLGDPQWTVIVDTIDGTRGLMYDKRPAWVLAAAHCGIPAAHTRSVDFSCPEDTRVCNCSSDTGPRCCPWSA